MNLWGVFEYIVPVLTIIVAFVLAFLHRRGDQDASKAASAILWLLALSITSVVVIQWTVLWRIESNINAMVSPNRDVQLFSNPQDIWKRANDMLRTSQLRIFDTTSLLNSDEYETRIAKAAADGAVITRVICAAPDRHVSDFIKLPQPASGARIRLLHFPHSSPFDFLVAEAAGTPSALIGLKSKLSVNAYELGLQVNDELAAQKIKTLISEEFIQVAEDHMKTFGATCSLCAELRLPP